MKVYKTPLDFAKEIDGWTYGTDEEKQKLLNAGFKQDPNYSAGATFKIDDDTPLGWNSIDLSRRPNQKYVTAFINGQQFAYPDLDTAIARATRKDGLSPYDGSLKWNGREWY